MKFHFEAWVLLWGVTFVALWMTFTLLHKNQQLQTVDYYKFFCEENQNMLFYPLSIPEVYTLYKLTCRK